MATDPVGEPTALEALRDVFTYHAPTDEQRVAYGEIRGAALALAETIHAACPPGPDRTAAIRKVREAVMTANAAIATGGIARFIR